jgi:sialic acid synthase SpsE
MSAFKVSGKTYTNRNPLIIAELGTSYGGDLLKAKEMVSAAFECGADCVKFQIVYADEILHPNTGFVPLPGGSIRLYDAFKNLEMCRDFFAAIKQYAQDTGVMFLASVFGPRSADELCDLKPEFVKIASPELNYTALLKKISAWRIPVVISSGVSKLYDIENALEILDGDFTRRAAICLLHCVTAYPAPASDYNISILPHLAGIFGAGTGVSDHTSEPILIPVLAVAKGACVIEKHFCLSRNGGGLDDPIALQPSEFKAMCRAVRSAQQLSEEEIIKEVVKEFGGAAADALGDGIKRLAASEKENYERTTRSIHALRNIKQGECFTADNIAVLRTEKTLRPGLPPVFYEKILSRTARNNIPSGEGIRFDDI